MKVPYQYKRDVETLRKAHELAEAVLIADTLSNDFFLLQAWPAIKKMAREFVNKKESRHD